MVSLLSVEDKHDGSQDLVHALSVAQLRLLLAVDEQQVQHTLPERGESSSVCVCVCVCVHSSLRRECVCVQHTLPERGESSSVSVCVCVCIAP